MDNFSLVSERLRQHPLPKGQYIEVESPKKTIVLHHTAGGSADSSIAGWIKDLSPVATPVVIDRDGTIVQCYPSKYWAYSLGVATANYTQLEKQSIPIEIASYGYLTPRHGNMYNAYGSFIHSDRVCKLDKPFRGQLYFEKYTDDQIESVRRLMLYWGEKYNIDLTYNPEMWDVSKRALRGDGGVWTHNSYRADKSDVFPQPELIEMLQKLKK